MSGKRTIAGPAQRVAAVKAALKAIKGGASPGVAMEEAGKEIGVHKSTVYEWYVLVRGKPKEQWLTLLDSRPNYGHRAGAYSYNEDVYLWFKEAYLSIDPPSQSGAYEMLRRHSEAVGWTIPSLRSLNRRLAAEGVPKRTLYDADL